MTARRVGPGAEATFRVELPVRQAIDVPVQPAPARTLQEAEVHGVRA